MQTKNQDVWDKILSKDEVVKEEFSVSDRYIKVWGTFWIIIQGLVTANIFCIGAILPAFYYFFILKKSNVFAFTNKGVLLHMGILSTSLISINYTKIDNVTVSQSFFQKIITGTGELIIDTAGTSNGGVIIVNIDDPYRLKRVLDELIGQKQYVSVYNEINIKNYNKIR